ncbi:hypothetical protein Nepgr_006995 [Nepenthes gracilis]|uniref:Pentatricopeptide repeat-containing protein n=1 Tax=Nepenthes gracilis TaxID=150966 RepID=A0AAD3S654_NEPGR|nr:hypothetical protein Nepgr_006995 [Nepenthes gracilis]
MSTELFAPPPLMSLARFNRQSPRRALQALMAMRKISSVIHQSLSSLHWRSFRLFSTLPWHFPPSQTSPFRHREDDPLLQTISQAIKNSHSKPMGSSLKRFVLSLKPHHIDDLINTNPLSLPPLSILNFFKWVSSLPGFRLTIHSYCIMAHFLSTHQLFAEAESLLRFVVFRKG